MTSRLVPLVVLAVLGIGVARAAYDSSKSSNELVADGSSVASRNAIGQRTPDDPRRALYCHTCSSLRHGDMCSHLAPNFTTFSLPCAANQTVCMVKRFSVTENATAPSVLWSIERNCSSKCEPGCLILGERTKIHVCVSCCTQHSCNIGNGSAGVTTPLPVAHLALSFMFIVKNIYATLVS